MLIESLEHAEIAITQETMTERMSNAEIWKPAVNEFEAEAAETQSHRY
jgi:hypothetical protein